jgi:hypothetical protein
MFDAFLKTAAAFLLLGVAASWIFGNLFMLLVCIAAIWAVYHVALGFSDHS